MIEKSSPLKLAIEQIGDSSLLQDFAQSEAVCGLIVESEEADLVLSGSASGVQLVWQSKEFGHLKYWIDVDAFAKQQKTFPLNHSLVA